MNSLSEFQIRRLEINSIQTSEIHDIAEILNHAIDERANAYLHPIQGNDVLDWFKNYYQSSQAFLICESNQKIVGWGGLSAYRNGREALRYCNEITFYVHRGFRGRGVAQSLLIELEEIVVQDNIKHLVAILLDSNSKSQSLLSKNGFKVWGRLPNIVQFEDAEVSHLYMGKPIST